MNTDTIIALRGKFFSMFLLFILIWAAHSFAQVNWTKYENNPVFTPGSPGEWDDEGYAGMCVIYDGSLYKMWYGASDGTYFRIGYATSPDGISWTKYDDPLTTDPPYAESDPVLGLGPGSFESVWVYFPTVYFDGSIYHMWYAGTNGNVDRIGYATSPDGINWTKDTADNPVINTGSSGTWDDATVDPGPVKFNGSEYEMIYNGYDGLLYQGGYATSPDGISWTKSQNPVLPAGSSSNWDYPRANPSSVVYNSNTSKYYIFYSGGEFLNWRIGCATADNFAGPWTKLPSIVVDVTPGSWDADATAFPTVIFDPGETLYKMWYVGGTIAPPGGAAIGYATSPMIPLPVELTFFTAAVNGKEVLINWSTATETNNHGFEIQRGNDGKNFATVGFVQGNGTTTEQHNYSYKDKGLTDGKYYYRLKQTDFNGSYEYSDIAEVDWRSFKSYLLEQNYPNPFNPVTTIGYGIESKSPVKITVMNAIGEQVAVLVDEEKEPGYYRTEFNAASVSGGLPSGVYFYRLQAGSFTIVKKMLLLK